MIAAAPFFRAIGGTIYPRGDVIAAHAVAVEPIHSHNVVASISSQDIVDIEARFDIEGPICWRDPLERSRFRKEARVAARRRG